MELARNTLAEVEGMFKASNRIPINISICTAVCVAYKSVAISITKLSAKLFFYLNAPA